MSPAFVFSALVFTVPVSVTTPSLASAVIAWPLNERSAISAALTCVFTALSPAFAADGMLDDEVLDEALPIGFMLSGIGRSPIMPDGGTPGTAVPEFTGAEPEEVAGVPVLSLGAPL